VLDEQVMRAMQKWPQVPAVYGWLRLSRRGQWFLIDRSRPDFDEARDGSGSLITSPPIIDFIGRNYEQDSRGAWYWQNGPQRAFVRLDLAPLILRVLNEPPRQRFVTHTGFIIERIERVVSDAAGNLLVQTDMGLAAVDDRDIGQLQLTAADESDESSGMRLSMELYPAPDTRGWLIETLSAEGGESLGQELGFIANPPPDATATSPSAAKQPQA